MENMSSFDIAKKYKQGRRDFSKIICSGANFSHLDLRGSVFRNSNFTYSDFTSTDLTDCDFTGADVSWSLFKGSIMRRTNFTRAKIMWSRLDTCIVEKVLMRKSDLSYSIINKCNFHEMDMQDANEFKLAKSIEEVDPEMAKQGHLMLKGLPFELALRIKFGLNSVADNAKRIGEVANEIGNYNQKLSGHGGGAGYAAGSGVGGGAGYAAGGGLEQKKKDGYQK